MGGDGQALSNKRRFLEESKVFVTAEEIKKCGDVAQTGKARIAQRWAHCAISLEPLEVPVVFDLCGRLYSKRSVLNELLERRHRPKSKTESLCESTDIMKLSDVCEVRNVEDGEHVAIRCPLTGFEASSGLHKFVGFWGCGHVVCTSSSPESVVGQKEEKNSLSGAEVRTMACLFCGEKSFPVLLLLDNKEEEVAQFRRLRPLQRDLCKRSRSKG